MVGDIDDSAIIPIPNSDLVMVKNIDIFTPIIDDPEIMGQIAAANVTNDVFAPVSYTHLTLPTTPYV